MTQVQQHWQRVYASKQADEVSWYEAHPQTSLALIQQTGLDKNAPIIDVGAGASTLVDNLLSSDYQQISCLDISSQALAASQARLGKRKDKVTWISADIMHFSSSQTYDLWHDRAVFHFLTDQQDKHKYLSVLTQCLRPQGHLIMATFSPDGPQICSGLNIVQYDATSLDDTLGPGFTLVQSLHHVHQTPMGREQAFCYCHFRKN